MKLVRAEAVDDLVDLALADVDAGDLGVEVAPVLLGQAHIVGDDAQQVLVEHAVAHQPHRRNAHALLMDLGQRARQRGRHRAADIGVVDVIADEADELAVAEDRLPQMDVGRVGRDVAGIGIVGDADVAFAVVEAARSRRRSRGRCTRWRRRSSARRRSGPPRVSTWQEKSSVSLTKVEWAVRISVQPMLSAAAAQ